MDEEIQKALDDIAAAVKWKPAPGPIVLSEEYLRAIERVENLPQNRPGTDKTWTERVLIQWKADLATVRRLDDPEPRTGESSASGPRE